MTDNATIPADTDERRARRELKRAERALAGAGRGPLAWLARERRDAAALRFMALTAYGATRTAPESR